MSGGLRPASFLTELIQAGVQFGDEATDEFFWVGKMRPANAGAASGRARMALGGGQTFEIVDTSDVVKASVTDTGAATFASVSAPNVAVLSAQQTFTNVNTFNPGTTPGDAIILDIDALGSGPATRNSHNIVWTARTHDGATPHTVNWRGRINVTAVDGTGSQLLLEKQLDGGGFSTEAVIDDNIRTFGFFITDAGTIGPTAAQQHTLPAVASDIIALLAATQTLTNKTLTTPTISSFANAGHNHQNAAGGAKLDHGLALLGLTDDDHTQYLLADGTRAMTGDLDMGGNDVTNAASITTTGPNLYKATAAGGIPFQNSSAVQIAKMNDDGTFTVATKLVLSESGLTVARTFTFPDATGKVVLEAATQTLTNKTLTTPTIGDFSNAGHSHQNAAGGATLDGAAIAAGTIADARLSTNVVLLAATQTLTNKTLTSPTIGDFSNAGHNHENAAGGGTLAAAALTALGIVNLTYGVSGLAVDTQFAAPGFAASQANEIKQRIAAMTLVKVLVRARVAGDGTNNVFTVRKNGVDTAFAPDLTTGTTADATGSVAFAEGDDLSIRFDKTGGATAPTDITITLKFRAALE